MGFITTNVMLSVYFEIDGKEKQHNRPGAYQKGIQKMVNETEDILNINHPENGHQRPL